MDVAAAAITATAAATRVDATAVTTSTAAAAAAATFDHRIWAKQPLRAYTISPAPTSTPATGTQYPITCYAATAAVRLPYPSEEA